MNLSRLAVQVYSLLSSTSLRKQAHAIYIIVFGCKNLNFQWENFDIFNVLAQNIDCGYTLEPPRRGSANEYP